MLHRVKDQYYPEFKYTMRKEGEYFLFLVVEYGGVFVCKRILTKFQALLARPILGVKRTLLEIMP